MSSQFRGLPLEQIPMVTGSLLACELKKLQEAISALEEIVGDVELTLTDEYGGLVDVQQVIEFKSTSALHFTVTLNGTTAEVAHAFNATGLTGNEVLRYNAGTGDFDFAPVGAITQSTYIHTQGTPALVWNISHGLNRYPSVTIVDTGNNHVEGEIRYVDADNIVVTFTSSFSGKAYLN